MELDYSSNDEEDIQFDNQISRQQVGQQMRFVHEDKLKNFCLDDNILLLLKFLNEKYPDVECMTLFNLINEQMMLESESTIRQIQPLYQASLLEYKNQKFKKAQIEISRLFRAINPLNFQKICDEVSESYNSSKEMNNLEVVMNFGNTGVGKSTFIHYLAGSIINKTINKEGLNHWEPTNPLYKALDRVISKPDAKSETKFVTLVKIKPSDQEGNEFGDDGEINLCDTPGFLDSEGLEAEISNLTGIHKCISVCKSIKPIILQTQLKKW
ncbi:helicase carboxy-terminal domain protein (macronuclear) [Tetrahymena thermophila SB210]|uniref:Helicase carboxy-terminal domain protein n=1 Tax=Tetrahymena thermophila (strain SB210) TaxID=312017 RepID=Q224N2_TETTS|nr:helicase carboxy-terminal domain protein [Tetrahymena thermophila SB210]EAR80748.2 helicase carboxy-terminal domain protein [Tetrahymena thermophila SB210]|eukprot:XP_001028411.2 helicase carboxy-terminal domain protein [Tetrahymena thermophila SB210]